METFISFHGFGTVTKPGRAHRACFLFYSFINAGQGLQPSRVSKRAEWGRSFLADRVRRAGFLPRRIICLQSNLHRNFSEKMRSSRLEALGCRLIKQSNAQKGTGLKEKEWWVRSERILQRCLFVSICREVNLSPNRDRIGTYPIVGVRK